MDTKISAPTSREISRARSPSWQFTVLPLILLSHVSTNCWYVQGSGCRTNTCSIIQDGGILDALKRGVLHAVRFTISTSQSTETRVVESYIIGIARNEGNNGQPLFKAITVDSLENSMMSLINNLKHMDAISEGGALSFNIKMFLSKDCPANYQPAGFSGFTQESQFHPGEGNRWIRCEGFDCGNYHTTVSINQGMDSASQIQHDLHTKAVLRGMQRSSSQANNDIHPTMSDYTNIDEYSG